MVTRPGRTVGSVLATLCALLSLLIGSLDQASSAVSQSDQTSTSYGIRFPSELEPAVREVASGEEGKRILQVAMDCGGCVRLATVSRLYDADGIELSGLEIPSAGLSSTTIIVTRTALSEDGIGPLTVYHEIRHYELDRGARDALNRGDLEEAQRLSDASAALDRNEEPGLLKFLNEMPAQKKQLETLIGRPLEPANERPLYPPPPPRPPSGGSGP